MKWFSKAWLVLAFAGHAFAQYTPYPTKTPTRIPPAPTPTPTIVIAQPTPSPTPTRTPAPIPTPTAVPGAGFPDSDCVRGEPCFKVQLICVNGGCSTTTRYLRHFRMDVDFAIVP